MPTNGTIVFGVLAAVCASVLLLQSALNLFYGWKMYRFFTATVTALLCVVLAWYFISPHMPPRISFIAPLLLGAIGLAVALPVQRVAAFVSTGALGSVACLAAAYGLGIPADFSSWKTIIIAAVGFLAAGIPAAMYLKFVVVFVTSAIGALGALTAAALLIFSLLSDAPPLDTTTFLVLALAWSTLTVTGMVSQYRQMETEDAEPA